MNSMSLATLEADLIALLDELSAAQTELLDVLQTKRTALMAADQPALEALQAREEGLIVRLEACHQRRLELLALASRQGRPAPNLRCLARHLPSDQRRKIDPQLAQTRSQARLLQHHSLTNWVIAQRTLLHLAQLLELIATGGRSRPTYGKDESTTTSGSLVDQAA
jgi:hypothetical protein